MLFVVVSKKKRKIVFSCNKNWKRQTNTVELHGGKTLSIMLSRRKKEELYRDLSGRDGRNSRHRSFCFFTKLLFPFNTGITQKKIILVSEVSSVEKKNKLFWSQNFSWGKEKQSWYVCRKMGIRKSTVSKKKSLTLISSNLWIKSSELSQGRHGKKHPGLFF